VRRRVILYVAVLVALGVAAAMLPLGEILRDVVTWIRGAGPFGVVLYAILYVIAILVLLPGGPLAIIAGFVFGPVAGPAIASPVIVIASAIAFLIGRSFLRPWAARRIAGSPRLLALDGAIEKAGFRTILLLRFAPIMPFNLLQYVLGATRLRLRDFAAGTFFGTMPIVIVFTQIGAGLSDVTQIGEAGPWHGLGLWIAIGVSIAAVALAVWFVRRAIDQRR
jgi:uncharacterized membrane protein YdjX (TVP38/TMEM64 family)